MFICVKDLYSCMVWKRPLRKMCVIAPKAEAIYNECTFSDLYWSCVLWFRSTRRSFYQFIIVRSRRTGSNPNKNTIIKQKPKWIRNRFLFQTPSYDHQVLSDYFLYFQCYLINQNICQQILLIILLHFVWFSNCVHVWCCLNVKRL